jgi:hypothetical protein
MSPHLRRKLWLGGLTLTLAHCVVLIVGAIGMWESRGVFAPNWNILPRLTAIAMWIHEPDWLYLAFNAVLDIPMLVAFALTGGTRRAATRLFALSVVVRLTLMACSVVAAIYLASLGRVQTQKHAASGTWRVYRTSEAVEQACGHIFLGAPLLIYALRWTPDLWPGHRRKVLRLREGRCLACGYDLRGNPGAVCPECGMRAMQKNL